MLSAALGSYGLVLGKMGTFPEMEELFNWAKLYFIYLLYTVHDIKISS